MRVLLVLLFSCALVAQSAPELEAKLNAAYDGKLLKFKHWYEADSQDYDADGNLLTEAREGQWIRWGVIAVKHVSLRDNAIEINASRMLVIPRSLMKHPAADEKIQFGFAKTEDSATVRLHLPAGDLTTVAASRAIGSVFATDTELFDLVPFTFQRAFDYLFPGSQHRAIPEILPQTFRVGRGVSAPEVVKEVEPSYTEQDRHRQIEGVVVLAAVIGTDGVAHQIHVIQPLTAGSEDQAVLALQQWRFRPAMKDGQPVPVQSNFEINFRLH